LIAKVVINSNTLSTDSIYDYLIPEHLVQKVKIGSRVKVLFGRSDRLTEAYVLDIVSHSEFQSLKPIADVINDISYFDHGDAELIKFMRHRYFCSYISAMRCLLPPGVNMKFINYYSLTNDVAYETIKEFCGKSVVADKIISCLNAYGPMTEDALKAETGKNNIKSTLRLLQQNGYIIVDSRGNESISDTKKTFVELAIDRTEAFSLIDSISRKAPARARVLEVLCDNYDMELSELLVCAETSKSTVDALHKKGLIAYHSVVCNNSEISYDASYIKQKPELSAMQQSAVDEISLGINSGKKSCYLIHGVTGSGKTEVYLSILEETIKKGKDAILMVPEISLTPQMISQIFGRFGNNVAVLHSRLTAKQRYIEWFKIKNGDVKIAVGARSAVFAPFKNLGLIIVDEEHESTYKAEMSPRYNAIEIARYRIDRSSGSLVLASATPLIDDYFKASLGTYKLIELPERINNSALPQVQIVDMRSELQGGNVSIFSNALKDAITKCLAKKEQIILFLNRRGFSGFVSCRNCGYVMKCPRCNVALTYHKSVNKMVCHYCDYKTTLHDKCPSCGNKHIRFFGIGTEKIVQELTKLYPDAKILRMDADTTAGRMAHENVLNHFRNGHADILVGTQMITKGLDFDNVTLVGIVAADMSLNIDDYRACERTFDLITQVVGRCGRASKMGKAIVQTYNPDDETIVLSAMQDYKKFYDEEIAVRRMLEYPPFTEFIKVQFSGADEHKVYTLAQRFWQSTQAICEQTDCARRIYPIAQSPLFKLNGKFRYRFMIKTPYKRNFYDALREVYDKYIANRDDVNITIDVNPNNSY